jgi:hypothetical protein
MVIGILNSSLQDAPLPTLANAQGINEFQVQALTSPYVTICYAQPSSTSAVTYKALLPDSANWCAMMVTLLPAAPFYPAVQPVRAHPALFAKGRIGSNPGVLAQSSTGPLFRQSRQAVRAVPPVLPRGRVYSSPGSITRVTPRTILAYQQYGPVAAKIILPLRGRTGSNPGVPVVLTPSTGPVVYPLMSPAGNAYRAPGPFLKGRTSGSPGAPVQNPVLAFPRFTYGVPYYRWTYGQPEYRWDYGIPQQRWLTGAPQS